MVSTMSVGLPDTESFLALCMSDSFTVDELILGLVELKPCDVLVSLEE